MKALLELDLGITVCIGIWRNGHFGGWWSLYCQHFVEWRIHVVFGLDDDHFL